MSKNQENRQGLTAESTEKPRENSSKESKSSAQRHKARESSGGTTPTAKFDGNKNYKSH